MYLKYKSLGNNKRTIYITLYQVDLKVTPFRAKSLSDKETLKGLR